MPWQGEEIFPRLLGMRGLKCVCYVMMEEVNRLRTELGKPPVTWQQVLDKLANHMGDFANDDNGPEP